MVSWTLLCLTRLLSQGTFRGVMQAAEIAVLPLTACCFSQDREFRIQAESMKRIVWDTERRCYLDPTAVVV